MLTEEQVKKRQLPDKPTEPDVPNKKQRIAELMQLLAPEQRSALAKNDNPRTQTTKPKGKLGGPETPSNQEPLPQNCFRRKTGTQCHRKKDFLTCCAVYASK